MAPETPIAPGAGLHPSTLAIHAGRGPAKPGGPLNDAPVFASAFHGGDGAAYAREGNPTWRAFEDAIGELEGGEAVSFPSGMSAAAAIIETLPPTADIVVASSAYAETRNLIGERHAAGHLRATQVDPLDLDAVGASLDGADALWVDAISNPRLDVPDLPALAGLARDAGAALVVDATLATPLLVRPLASGADLVLHSATKFIGGHSDLLLGVATAADEARAARLRDARSALGASPGTMESWLALRGLRTLPLRLERGQRTAALLAERLGEHSAVDAVRYPGIGAVLSFSVGGGARADAVCRGVRLITHATSLGGVETLIERPGRWHRTGEVSAGLLRLSVGCEEADDLWSDLDRALVSSGARGERRAAGGSRRRGRTPETGRR